MRDLCKNPDITIKPADKGGSIVIMNTEDYIVEDNRQISNKEHYKTLDEEPTYSYNKYIHHLIDQAWRMGIIDKTSRENLQTKNPRIPSFYLLPEIHKPSTRQTYSQQYWLSHRKDFSLCRFTSKKICTLDTKLCEGHHTLYQHY